MRCEMRLCHFAICIHQLAKLGTRLLLATAYAQSLYELGDVHRGDRRFLESSGDAWHEIQLGNTWHMIHWESGILSMAIPTNSPRLSQAILSQRNDDKRQRFKQQTTCETRMFDNIFTSYVQVSNGFQCSIYLGVARVGVYKVLRCADAKLETDDGNKKPVGGLEHLYFPIYWE